MDPTVSEFVKYIQQLNVDGAATGESDPKIRSLFKLPLEVRHQIYSYFLKCPKATPIEGPEGKSVFDFKVLSICQQIRDDALDYFGSANRWIEYLHYPLTEDAKNPTLECTNKVAVPLDLFPAHDISALTSRITLTIRVGKDCGLEECPADARADRKVFAYNRQTWVKVCAALAQHVRTYKNLSIDLATRFHDDYEALFPDFLSYLSLIRDAERVHFHGFMGKPLFNQMQYNMARPLRTVHAFQEFFKGLCEQSDFELSRNDAESARRISSLGIFRYSSEVGYHMPLASGVLHLFNELIVTSARLNNNRIKQSKINGTLPPDAFRKICWNYGYTEAIKPWPYMSDEHRMQKHHEQGRLFLLLAEYAKVPGNLEYARATCADYDHVLHLAEREKLYNLAAHQFMYATDLETVDQGQSWKMWQDVVASSDFDAEASYRPTISIWTFPGYGVWRGDARWLVYHSFEVPEASAPAGFCFKTEEELKSRKDELGITWDERPGLLRLMLAEMAGQS